MGFLKEFKDFAMRGNLVDFAIGVVVGGAFGKVTASFVDGIVMPIVGKLVGGADFSELKYKIQDGSKEVVDATGTVTTKAVPEVYIKYGEFINVCIDFIVIAFVMFLVIKAMNRMKKEEPAPAPAGPTKDQELLGEIRDLLKK
ncbi:MAG TPA: large-conductance mechanosensitive channel protein MscL [Bacteroidia bacterium]|jgi:large conductance mechanosensitive channel|nr:large-conductance mechanosensitive channel protein MscL [Bacteroidia bacterium]HMU19515.1 large-conductance mechanosensitive channel protein MscL [Bacteroidia bacterium]